MVIHENNPIDDGEFQQANSKAMGMDVYILEAKNNNCYSESE